MRTTKPRVIEEVKARQRNIVFLDTVRNSRNVDAFLLRGDPNAPLVQRVGAWIFGLFFLLCGIACLGLALNSHSWADIIYSIAGFLIGIKVLLSGFRRRRKSKALKK
jgi:hypothetical protein